MREQVGAGRCMVGGDLNLPAGHGLDCEDVSANGQKHANNTAQLPWPGKRRKMFLKKLATGKWGNECVSCVLNASLIFCSRSCNKLGSPHHPPGSPLPLCPSAPAPIPSSDSKLWIQLWLRWSIVVQVHERFPLECASITWLEFGYLLDTKFTNPNSNHFRFAGQKS